MTAEAPKVANDQAFPTVEQLSYFLPNRVGALQRIVGALRDQKIEICAVAIRDAHDHAVVRMLVDLPGKAREILTHEGTQVLSTPVLGVTLSYEGGHGIADVLGALLRAELNVHYCYAMISRNQGRPILAVHVDDPTTATQTLRRAGVDLIDQRDLEKDG